MSDTIKLERIFMIIAAVVGSLIIFISPPMSAGDENAHFYNAYTIGTGKILPKNIDGKIGKYVPKNVIDFSGKYHGGYYAGKLDVKYNFKSSYFDNWLPLKQESREEQFIDYWGVETNPIGYIVSGLGVAVGKILLESADISLATPYNYLIFCKFFNLLFYIFVMAFAIAQSPYFKRTLFMLALMPMSIYMGASAGYDAILVPVSFLLFSYTLKLKYSDENYKISKKDIIIIALIAFFLGGIKHVYSALLLILFIIPKSKFRDNKQYFVSIGVVALVCISAFLIPKMIYTSIASGVKSFRDDSMSQQINYIFDNIFQLPYIFYNSYVKFKGFYIEGFFGKLGSVDTNFPLAFMIIFYLILIIITVIDICSFGKIKWKEKIYPFLGALIAIFATFMSMYIMWTSIGKIAGVGVDYVSGVQGRYFVPVFPFLLILFANGLLKKEELKLSTNTEAAFNNLVVVSSSIFGAMTILILLLRYWV